MTTQSPLPSKKLAVVTGASSGIGRASALRLAENGYDLVLIARREKELQELALEISNRYGSVIKTEIRVIDMSESGAAKKALEGLAEIKVLVNNAGFNKFGAIVDQTETDWMQMINLNCLAVISMCKEAVHRMTAGAVIVNVSSLAADIPLPYMSVYAASKAFVTNFSWAFREEVRKQGIRVVSLNPGGVRTDFVLKAGMPGRVNRENDRLLVSADYVAQR
ncbi:MAG: SDR family NAD(P)-dependent oxidoreductase, partial [Bdellovibrionota bacterium]